MTTGQIVTNQGKIIALNRLWNASPTYSAPTVFKVGTGSTTPAVTDTDLVTPVTIGGASTKIFVSGYPTLTESSLMAKTRCLLLTTECNGNSLTEFGIFNTDGTKKCFSRNVHTAITKTLAVQVVYLEVDKIQ